MLRPTRWAPLIPSALLLPVLLADGYAGRRHDPALLLAASIGYLILTVVWAGVAWRWHRRHLLAVAAGATHRRRLLELRSPTRARYLAPLGVVLFGFTGVLMAVHVVEGIADAHWQRVFWSAVFLPVWVVLGLRCGLACRRLVADRRAGRSRRSDATA